MTSLLTAISGAIATRKPLPLYLKAQKLPLLSELLTDLDASILTVQHVCEPGYSAFAVMEVTLAMMVDDLSELLRETKNLVGEMDFIADIVRDDDLVASVHSSAAAEKRD